jgi:hypothetical protein
MEAPHVQEDDISERDNSLSIPLLSREQANKQSLAFGRAAVIFQNRLTSVRRKQASAQTLVDSPNPKLVFDKSDACEDAQIEADQRRQKPVRILRAIQGALTAIIAVSIAVFQGKAYVNYFETKDQVGAWPSHPKLEPTLLLFAVAIMAFTFDGFLIVAYTTHDKGIAGKAYKVAD